MFCAKTKWAKTVTSVVLATALGAGIPGSAGAGFLSTGLSRSEAPCWYSVQLQQDVRERRRYMAKLAELVGAAERPSAVEEMYLDAMPASYRSEESGGGFAAVAGYRFADPEVVRLEGVDAISRDCIGCHDGANAVNVDPRKRNDPWGGHGRSAGGDHPIGMDYKRYVAANSRKYKPVFQRSSAMVFVDGKVGCLTCHNPLNPERKHLVMSDQRSALCLTCHDK